MAEDQGRPGWGFQTQREPPTAAVAGATENSQTCDVTLAEVQTGSSGSV